MTSSVSLRASALIKACDVYLARHRVKEEERRERYIANEMKRKRWWGLARCLTREEVEAQISPLESWILSGWWRYQCERLRKMAIMVDPDVGCVDVDEEMAVFLYDYWEHQ
jgi:hypothetical protein